MKSLCWLEVSSTLLRFYMIKIYVEYCKSFAVCKACKRDLWCSLLLSLVSFFEQNKPVYMYNNTRFSQQLSTAGAKVHISYASVEEIV